MSASASASTSSPPHTHWTVADYMALGPEHPRCELLAGELLMSPAPTAAHQRFLASLLIALGQWVYEHELGECLPAPIDVVLDEDTVVQPDLVYVSTARFAQLHDGHGLTGAPDLVVEVLSPSTARLDRTRKRSLYQRSGVAWLMLVDPEARTVEVMHLGEHGRYEIVATAGGDDSLALELFPGLTLELAGMWLPQT